MCDCFVIQDRREHIPLHSTDVCVVTRTDAAKCRLRQGASALCFPFPSLPVSPRFRHSGTVGSRAACSQRVLAPAARHALYALCSPSRCLYRATGSCVFVFVCVILERACFSKHLAVIPGQEASENLAGSRRVVALQALSHARVGFLFLRAAGTFSSSPCSVARRSVVLNPTPHSVSVVSFFVVL